jgi:hypothetical protein
LSFHESVSALRGEPRRTSREGLEPSRARWAAAGRPWGLRRAFGASQPSAFEPSRAP